MLRVCRQHAPLCLASFVHVTRRWVPSEQNVADDALSVIALLSDGSAMLLRHQPGTKVCVLREQRSSPALSGKGLTQTRGVVLPSVGSAGA